MKFKLLLLLILFHFSLGAQQKMIMKQAEEPSISDEQRADLINSVADLFESNYVFPEKGKLVQKKLKAAMKEGQYNNSDQVSALLEALKKDIQAIISDAHFNMIHFPPDRNMNWVSEGDSEEKKEDAEKMMLRQAQAINFGISEVKILDGNIGYLNLSSFNVSAEDARPQLATAFNFLQYAGALIIDMRQNGGGSPEYVSLLESYFFEKPTLISTIFNRTENSTTEFRTVAEPGGTKALDKPVFILTGPATGSGGEAFPYNMQAFNKATVVGEPTIGGANGFTPIMLDFQDLGRLAVLMPDMRVENVRTQSNWERVGVKPDIEVTANLALETAHKSALESLMQKETSEEQKAQYEAIISKIDYQIQKAKSGQESASLEEFAGKYGIRSIRIENGALMFSRENGPKIPLVESGEDQFDLDIPLTPKPHIKFDRDSEGKITGFYLIQGEGNGVFNKKEK